MEMDLNYTHANAKRYQRHYTVVLIDVDFFKKYNDHYGHQKGDDALRLVAKSIRSGIRSSDRLYRYGGEELLLLLPETYPLVGTKVVDRVLQIIRNKQEPHCESEIGVLTVSAGLCAFEPGCGRGWEDIMKESDEQLYLSKQRGRNCVSWSGDQDSITAAAV
jgi:diguanylate cyclase (GGDEF)-like protein